MDNYCRPRPNYSSVFPPMQSLDNIRALPQASTATYLVSRICRAYALLTALTLHQLQLNFPLFPLTSNTSRSLRFIFIAKGANPYR
eukprot:scaffold5076_cov123-Skeletonema_dohrnii-CCMP3373.AAC.2